MSAGADTATKADNERELEEQVAALRHQLAQRDEQLAELTGKEVVRLDDGAPSMPQWAFMQEIASELCRASVIPDALRYVGGKKWTNELRPIEEVRSDVLAIIIQGHECGLGPQASLQLINIIDGKPSMSATGMGALIRKHGHKLEGDVERDEQGKPIRAWIRGTRTDTSETLTVDYTIGDAAAAELCILDPSMPNGVKAMSTGQKPKPLPWQLHTASMLWARAMSAIGRRLFSDVLAGIAYTPEELAPTTVQNTAQAQTFEPLTDDERLWLNKASKAMTADQRTHWHQEWLRAGVPDTPGRQHFDTLADLAEKIIGDKAGERPTPADGPPVDAELVDTGPQDAAQAPEGVEDAELVEESPQGTDTQQAPTQARDEGDDAPTDDTPKSKPGQSIENPLNIVCFPADVLPTEPAPHLAYRIERDVREDEDIPEAHNGKFERMVFSNTGASPRPKFVTLDGADVVWRCTGRWKQGEEPF